MAESDHNLMYEKRPGTDNEGGDYELYIAVLCAVILALDDAVHDVQIASNVDKYGAFDDVAIKVYYKNGGGTVLYLLQLKHKKNRQKCVCFTNKTNGDFSLEKYKESYYKDVRARISRGDRDDLLRGVELKDIVFCLFTNADFPGDTDNISLDKRASLSCKALRCSDTGFIDTTSGGYHIFQMNTERPGFAEFLSSYLFTGYQKGYEDTIKKIGEKFRKCEVNRMMKEIGSCFKAKLKSKIQDEMNFDGILISVGESVKESFREVETDLLEEIVSKVSDYFRVECQRARKGYEEYSSKCAEYSQFFQQFRFYGGQLNCKQVVDAIALKIKERLGKFKLKIRESLELIRVYFQGNRLLVKQQIQQGLLELVLPPALSSEEFQQRFRIFRMVTDLNDPKQKLMVSEHIKVALQGRKAIGLCELVDSSFCQSLKPEFLLIHMGGAVHVGKRVELKCENYIKRKFCKIYLKRSTLWKSASCIFVLSVSKRCDTLCHVRNLLIRMYRRTKVFNLRKRQDLSKRLHNTPKNCVIVISKPGDDVDKQVETLMKLISFKVKRVHYLNMTGNLLEWRGSRIIMNSEGQTDLHNNFSKNTYIPRSERKSLKEENLLQHFKSVVNIISAKPGMGKSTVLDSLIQYCPANKWVLKLHLNEWNNDLHNRFQEILDDPLQYIFEKTEGVCHNEFSKDLFRYLKMKSKNAMVVLIDAFDEISPKYTDHVLKLIGKLEHMGVCTWVFTRPNLEERLEQNFNTTAIKILPLAEDEIRDYLLKNIKANKPSLEGLLQKMMDFVKIPLHLYMLTTSLCSETLDWNKLNVTDLYETFVTTKCDIYYKKFGIDMERNHVEDLVVKPESLIEKHQLLSLLVFIEKSRLVRMEIASHSELEGLLSEIKEYKNHVGLVSVMNDSILLFSHRTFAEFLTARWLSLNIHHKAFKEVYEFIKFDSVQFWLDKIITREHPLHAAVVDRNLKSVRRLCNQCNRNGLVWCDALKRTPLHLAMNYYKDEYLRYDFFEQYLESKNCEAVCNIINEICEHCANTKSFVSQRNVFGSHWQEYAAACDHVFLGGCYWGCKALMMMYLTANYFLSENVNDIQEGIKFLIQRSHIDCLRLLFVCDVLGNFEEIKSQLGVPPVSGVRLDEYLWQNFEPELAYALKFFIVNDSPYNNDPLFKQRFHNQRILEKFLEDTRRKFITSTQNDFEAEEECLGLTSIRENLNILERLEIVAKIKSSGCTPLCAAAFIGSLNSVQLIANMAGTVNVKNPRDECVPLHYAVEGGNIEVITWLIEAGADVNQVDSIGNVALHHLLQHCLPDFSLKDFQPRDELLTVGKNKLDIMKLLIDKGAEILIKNHSGESCFGLAVGYNYLDVVKLFIENGIDVDYSENDQWTGLFCAVNLNHLEYVKYFLDKGADVNIKFFQMNLLDFALRAMFVDVYFFNINWQIVRLLMEKDANVSYAQNQRLFAPLISAVEKNHLDAAQYLVNKQSNVTTPVVPSPWSSLNETLFILVTARTETCDYIHELLIKNEKNSLAILFSSAIAECHANLRKFAVEDTSFYIKIKMSDGNSHFGKAVKNEKWELVKFYIEIGINVDYRDHPSEFTALHKAVKTDRLDYVKHFIDLKANVHIKACEKTSLDLAFENEKVNWEMVRLLVESGADVNCRQNQKGYTPLHYAVEGDRLDMVEFLINKKADVSITDGSGAWTPSQLACHLGRKNIMNFFIQGLV